MLVLMQHPLMLMTKRKMQTFSRQYQQPKEVAKGCLRTMICLSLISKEKQHPLEHGVAKNVAKLDTMLQHVEGLHLLRSVQEGGHSGPVGEGAEGGYRGNAGVVKVLQRAKMKLTTIVQNNKMILHHQHQKTEKKTNKKEILKIEITCNQ
jgi:preprotein translocase subunit SecG